MFSRQVKDLPRLYYDNNNNLGALGWSLFTILTPFAARWHFAALIIVRILLGVAEGKQRLIPSSFLIFTCTI